MGLKKVKYECFFKTHTCVYSIYILYYINTITGLIIVWTILVFTARWRH